MDFYSWNYPPSSISIFFYSCFHLYGNLPLTYPPPFPVFSFFLSLPPEVPPMRMWPQPFSSMLYRICTSHKGIEKLRKTCADTVGHLTESVLSLTVSEKWPPAQRFDVQAADRQSSIQVLTQRKAAWLGWSPGTGHLPHTEHCRSVSIYTVSVIYWGISKCEIKTREALYIAVYEVRERGYVDVSSGSFYTYKHCVI